jgi:hypothetical protein
VATIADCRDRGRESERAVPLAVSWIDAHGVPDQIKHEGASEPFAAITVPSEPPVTVRKRLR